LRGGEEKAESLYDDLVKNGVEVLLDDRDETPGVKFNDADLIGIPIRLTVSKRSLTEESVEIKLRHEKEKSAVKYSEVVEKVKQIIANLETGIKTKVVDVPFDEGA
jgi:prolyl-tRNA synthetase